MTGQTAAAKSKKNLGISNIKKLGNKIEDLSASSGIRRGNVIVCNDGSICVGSSSDDIIYAGATGQVYGVGKNDIIFGNTQNQLYGGTGDDMVTTGGGSNLADGGPGDDVLLGSGGNDLLIGGSGDDKIFAGPGNSVMDGGPGSDHFDCGSVTTTVGPKAVVLDYNPSQGDTISGNCKIVNTESSSSSSSLPQVTSGPSSGDISGAITQGVQTTLGSSK
jgi:Ca2+-binding RTX toxin-like protein